MNTTSRFLVLGVLLSVSSALAQNNRVNWWSFEEGFATSRGSNLMLLAAVGQNLVGSGTAGNTMLTGGFLADTRLHGIVIQVGRGQQLPLSYSLSQNYPNPFNPSTTIRFELPHLSRVSLKVYSLLGQEVMTLVDEEKQAGVYEVQFDAGGVSSGMYVYRLHAGDYVAARKLLIVR